MLTDEVTDWTHYYKVPCTCSVHTEAEGAEAARVRQECRIQEPQGRQEAGEGATTAAPASRAEEGGSMVGGTANASASTTGEGGSQQAEQRMQLEWYGTAGILARREGDGIIRESQHQAENRQHTG